MVNYPSMHSFVDVYQIPPDLAENAQLMGAFIEDVRCSLFDGKGNYAVSKVSEPNRPHNDGVSGAIIAPAKHLTFHTFSRRNVAFLDVFAEDDPTILSKAHELAQKYFCFQRQDCVICRDDLGEGFGTHVVITANESVSVERANRAINQVIVTIKMTPLNSRIVLRRAGHYGLLQMITESHIAFHGDSEDTIIDVFSCKPFDVEAVLDTLRSCGIRIDDHYVVSRGTKLSDKAF